MTEEAHANELPPLKGRTLLIASVSLALATFMNVLDVTIANVSIPAISGNLGVSPTQGTWIITSFAVANAIGVPLTGWLTQRFGSVQLFVTSVLLFTIASTLCGLSVSLPMLLFFRVVQGFVAGPMIPLSMALLLQSFPREKAGMGLALWSMTALVGPVTGPILGGWLTDNLSWPWIFYINIPVGLIAAWSAWAVLKKRSSPTSRVPIDKIGLGLLIIWVGALQIMLDKGRELDWFNSGEITLLALTSAVGCIVFLIWELAEPHPIVDLRLFRQRNFCVGVIAYMVGYGLYFGNLVLLPLWLQQHMGYTATWAGLVTAPAALVALVVSPIVGKYITRFDPRLLASIGFAGLSTMSFIRSDFNTNADVVTLLWPQIAQGIGVAAFFIPLTTIVLSEIPASKVPLASGLSNFMRNMGAAVFASLALTIWDHRATLHHARLVEGVQTFSAPAHQAVDALTSLGLDTPQALGVIEHQLNTQAFMLGLDDFFRLSGFLSLMLIPLVWTTKVNKIPNAAPTHAAAE
jgi:MFS transporter, DHA2 family, multidrug resistance protein